MPRYAVDFLAEIQEVNSTTLFDECSETVDLLTNFPNFNVLNEETTKGNNVVGAPMGNAQCCFRRYPGYQAHRHVVVSRGIQCSEGALRKTVKNDTLPENNHFLLPQGDNINENSKDAFGTSESGSLVHHKADLNSAFNLQVVKGKPEIMTLASQEPPELRESSKFFKKKLSVEFKNSRKYFEDDIDSLSATISNYSFHEKLLKMDANRHIKDNPRDVDKTINHFSNALCSSSIPHLRQISFKGSMDAMRGSTTKTFSHDSKASNKNDFLENQSSDSFTSFGHTRDQKCGGLIISADSTETTPMEVEKVENGVQTNANNETQDKSMLATSLLHFDSGKLHLPHSSPSQQAKSRTFLQDKKEEAQGHQKERQLKQNSDSKCSSSVTFMKGSEEAENNEHLKSLDSINNLNALRRKQRFLMRHTRNNSKITTATSSDCPNPISAPELLSNTVLTQIENTNLVRKSPTCLDGPGVVLEFSTPKTSERNQQVLISQNEKGRNRCSSRNSNHSERVATTPVTNPVKMRRSVSFDKNKVHDSSKKVLNDKKIAKADSSNHSFTRNTVRAKYCSNKVLKQRFYIPESANIEHILLDPSDRRIKAICDRHNCDIEIYSKVPKSGFLKNIIVLAAPNSENLRKCVRSLDYSMCWCLTAQLA